jgi:hypothetical protein
VLLVALPATLRREEVIVAAPQALRVGAAHARPRLVYRAPPSFSVEELAHRLEDVILLMAKYPVSVCDLRETFLSLFIAQMEM